jgi:hypothetical protein
VWNVKSVHGDTFQIDLDMDVSNVVQPQQQRQGAAKKGGEAAAAAAQRRRPSRLPLPPPLLRPSSRPFLPLQLQLRLLQQQQQQQQPLQRRQRHHQPVLWLARRPATRP